jgi:HEAT repeat protein
MSKPACEWVRERIALFVYGELPMEQEERLQAHTEECAQCREHVAAERRVHLMLDESVGELPANLLVECRRGLNASLARERGARRPAWRRLGDFFRADAWVWKPVAAGALVALGFSGAKWHSQYELNRQLAAVPPAQVRLLKALPDGSVEIAYDVAQRKIVRGKVGDESIRALLMRAASESSDADTRSRTVEALASAGTEQTRDTLLNVARRDPNSSVRAKAVSGLRAHMNERSTRRALVEVLRTDDDHVVRGQVADLFGLRPPNAFDTEVIGVLQEMTRRETDNGVRAKYQKVLAGAGASPYIF